MMERRIGVTFQLTASQGGWPFNFIFYIIYYYFNSQPHKEADKNRLDYYFPILAFQLTASQGGWQMADLPGYGEVAFQLTASQGGWPASASESATAAEKFQLTASQGGWRAQQIMNGKRTYISTHSLTRRLTYKSSYPVVNTIFQLTASQGGWRRYGGPGGTRKTFQLTASQGGWLRELMFSRFGYIFQLTASQGGWPGKYLWWRSRGYFNSQPHKEADTLWYHRIGKRRYFNSQPHKEADSRDEKVIHVQKHFNSQPHKEADESCLFWLLLQVLFQLTASQGGWQLMTMNTFNVVLFQLTASQGGWRQKSKQKYSHPYFNSQPHKEADDQPVNHLFSTEISTHSLTRRLTERIPGEHLIEIFQLTASQGGWPIAL